MKIAYIDLVVKTATEFIKLSSIFNRDYKDLDICGIYCIKNKITSKVYIGSSRNIRGRLLDHLYRLKKKSHYNPYLQRAFLKEGEDAFYFAILCVCNAFCLLEKEQFYLDMFKHNGSGCYNIAITTNGTTLAEETKRKISKSLIGQKRRLGFKVTDETKEKLRVINTGKIPSAETRTKISIALKGKNTWAKDSIKGHRTSDTKEKISIKNKGSGNGMAKSVIYTKNNIIEGTWGCAVDAAITYGIKAYTLRKYIINNIMYNGGYFKYEDINNNRN